METNQLFDNKVTLNVTSYITRTILSVSLSKHVLILGQRLIVQNMCEWLTTLHTSLCQKKQIRDIHFGATNGYLPLKFQSIFQILYTCAFALSSQTYFTEVFIIFSFPFSSRMHNICCGYLIEVPLVTRIWIQTTFGEIYWYRFFIPPVTQSVWTGIREYSTIHAILLEAKPNGPISPGIYWILIII